EPPVVSGRSGMPAADGSEGDRPVRGRATARVVSGPPPRCGLHHEVEPVATQNPPAAEDEDGLRHLTEFRAPPEIRRYSPRDVRKVGGMCPFLRKMSSFFRRYLSRAEGIDARTVRRRIERYRKFGLAGLARKVRRDKDTRKLSTPLYQVIEGLALKKPRLSVA